MMMTKALRAEIRDRREPTVMFQGKLVPGSIPFVRGLIESVTDPFDRDALLGELSGEYLRAGFEDEHLLVQRERVANHPEAAIMWLGLAHSLSMQSDGIEEAKTAAAKGLEISRRVGTLIRYALSCQADIARKAGDATLFESSMRQLIEDAPNQRDDDCALSDHLVVNLPPNFCSSEIEAEYRRLLPKEEP